MAEFRKCFENLDTEKRGVITIDDLKTYMRKMHYKETFLHKWIELFDPDHNGFITYEQYCKTLGLIPRKRTISKNFTDSSASISPKHEDSSGILIHSSDLKTSISRLDPSEEHRTSKEQSSSHPDVVSQEQDSYIYTQENVEVIIPVAQKFSSPSIVEITSEQNDPVEDIESNNLIPKSTTTEEMLINEVETNLVCHEKMTGRKRKYADEKSELLIGNNIHSSINDQLLESDFIPNEVTNQMMSTEVIIMDQNECNPLEHLKSTSEVYSLPENLSQQKSQQIEQHILSNEQVLLSVPQKKSAKKSKKKRKQTLELSQQVEEMIVDDHLKSHENSHTSITCELIKNTDLHDTVVFESESCQTVTMKETLISDTQYQKEVIEKSVNVYDSHFQSDKPVITKVTKTSSKKHAVPLNSNVQITIEEDNKDLIPSNDAPISKPGMSISIDSGNSEPSDLISSSSSSSSAAAAPAGTHYKADTPSCNSGSSSQVFEVGSENSSPTPSAGVLIESSKLSNWSSSSEKISQRNNKTQDEELHDDSISEQMKDDGLSKKADKKKQNTHLDKIPDDPILSQSTDLIGQALIQSNISSTIIHDSDILPDEVQQASELLIDPQKIKSMHKTPQELTDESILTIVSSKLPDTEVSSTQLSSQASKNESKKSKKKHEKISHEVGKPLEVTTGNFNHIMLTSTNTTPSDEQAKLMELDISSCQVASELSDINRSHLTTVDISLNGTTITIPKKSPCKQSKMKSMSTSLNDEKLTNEIHINLPNSSFITEKVQLSSIIPLSNYNSDKSTRNETQFIQSSLQVLNDERQEQSRHIIDNLLFNNTELNNIPSNNNNRPIVNSKKKQKETTKPIKDRIDDFKKDKVVKEHLSPDVSLRTLINKTESSLLLASSSNKSINQASQNFNKQESNKKNKKNKLSLCNDDDNFISLESSVLNIMKTHQSSINPQQENKISNKIIYPQMNQKCSTSKKKLSLPKLKKIKNKNKLNSIDQTHQYVMNESIMEQSKIINTDMKESQENLRKRRFPKSFMTQVDPKYNRSVRIAAKRRKVNSDEKTNESSSSSQPTEQRKRTVKRRYNRMLKRWRIRSSLSDSGVIVILLAGRHRGKRVVCLGRQKSSGLLLVTGPYCYNGCPLRRVHPDYVIATKTKIDLSELSLPKRIHGKDYFRRSTSIKSHKFDREKHFKDILEQGDKNHTPIYTPSNEKKSDQIYIDDEVKKAIKLHTDSKILIAYLKSLFSIGKYDRPHEMFF